MNKTYLALILLLNVGFNVIGMEPNNGFSFFNGLSEEESKEFNQEFSGGSLAADLLDQYYNSKQKQLLMGRDFPHQDIEELKYTEDMIDFLGFGCFVDRQSEPKVKELHRQAKRRDFNRPNVNNSRRLSFSSSSASSEEEKIWRFVHYTPQDITRMSISSNSSSSSSE